ncbi:hypothetical protein TrLO_g172 [Triparma laevis f. longispina]|uniref:Peptidyl-prolyl cis-trans isomerase n=1 Tax=Triparma laevis f. longispina TaxID=1714387 RepID=A0A9W6ZFG5_9STRA|nr:hypothetical protein TrLO_g172 [Triparma laevis f. longispina]
MSYAGEKEIVVTTSLGKFTIELYYLHSPTACDNISQLSNASYFADTNIHRVTPHVLQFGDPSGTGSGGVAANGGRLQEKNELKHVGAGVCAMVEMPGGGFGSQMYITLKPCAWADGSGTIFGRVKEGMDVVERIGRVEVKGEAPKNVIKVFNIEPLAGPEE